MQKTYIYLIIGIVIVGIIALFGSAEAKDFTTGQMASLAFCGAALVWMLGGNGWRHFAKGGESFSAIGLWVGVIALLAVVYTFKDDMQRAGGRITGGFNDQSGQYVQGKSVILNKVGAHFTARVNVNNKAEISMMVDTGASSIALSYEDAASLGIPVELLVFDRETSTANGKAMSAALTLDVVRIGEIELTKVRASISQRGALKQSLLGMSFLEKLQSYGAEDGQMILKGR
jgi:aspartyl protease family protein